MELLYKRVEEKEAESKYKIWVGKPPLEKDKESPSILKLVIQIFLF
jgi:hypothetical protein